MPPGKHLVSRTRVSETSSPAQRRRRDGGSRSVHSTSLPPYEPPAYPLSASQRRALDSLRLNYDRTKYKNHIKASMKLVTGVVGDSNDRLTVLMAKVKRTKERARRQQRELTEAERENEQYTWRFEKKVVDGTEKGEKAIRKLIDYGDELAMRDSIMTEVSDKIAATPAPRLNSESQMRRLDEDGDEENGGVGAPVADGTIIGPLELLKQTKGEYHTTYTARTMRERYLNNDYRGFKQTVHDAMFPGDNAPPVPHPATWFPQDRASESGNNQRRTSAANNNSGEEEDNDVIIASATTNIKCPLTLQVFQEPYSNNVCKHSFEKSAIIEYHRENGVVFVPPNQRRGPRPAAEGPKQVRCPALGCDAMLELQDFYDDQVLLRQVKRAQRKDVLGALGMEDDDERRQSHQGRRVEEVDEEEDEEDEEEEEDGMTPKEQRRRTLERIKKERQGQ